MNIAELKEQHENIRLLIDSIKELINRDELITQFEVSFINKLNASVKEHLESEDKYLYPALMQKPDQKVRDIAKRFVSHMNGVTNSFNEYVDKFNVEGAIIGQEHVFIIETQFILSLLSNRIQLEEEYLFPLY